MELCLIGLKWYQAKKKNGLDSLKDVPISIEFNLKLYRDLGVTSCLHNSKKHDAQKSIQRVDFPLNL